MAGHADFMDVPRESQMAKTLYAVDELSGFVAACALVRPTGIEGLTPKSVKKKLKQPSFAAGVNRDDVRRGAEELGVDFDEHVAFVIAAMEARADELGLAPQSRPSAVAPAPPALAQAARCATEQKTSGMRCSPRCRTRVSVTSPSGSPQWAQVPSPGPRPPARRPGGIASQCAPCISQGTTCSSRQKAASRAPGCSWRRQPSSRSTARSHQEQRVVVAHG